MLTFEMCLCGTAKCWYLPLSDIIKKDFESLTEQFSYYVVEMTRMCQNALVHLMAMHRGLMNVSTIIHAITTMITFLTEGTTIYTPSV